jgi:hypothetical protein
LALAQRSHFSSDQSTGAAIVRVYAIGIYPFELGSQQQRFVACGFGEDRIGVYRLFEKKRSNWMSRSRLFESKQRSVVVVFVLLAILLAQSFLPTGLRLPLLDVSLAQAQTGTAKVRVMHSSFDAPAVDVQINGATVLTNVAYRAVSDYLDVPAGNVAMKVLATGTNNAVVDTVIPLRPGVGYTLVASGPVGELAFRAFEDDLAAPAANQAKVRFYRMSEVMAAVDYIFRPASGADIVVPITYPKTAGIYSEIPAGRYEFIVYAAGTRDTPVITLPLDLQAGTINSVVATGNPPDLALQLQLVTNQPTGASRSSGPAKLRAIHSSFDAPAVDISVNGSVVLRNVAYRAVSDYLDVPAGPTRIQLFPTGTTTAVVDLTVPLRAGAAYSLAATNSVAELAPRLFEDVLTPPTGNAAAVRFYRMSEVMATVDYIFRPASGAEIVVPSTFAKTAGLYTEVPAGRYDFIVYAAGTRENPVINLNLNLAPGSVNSIVATGNPPTPALQLEQISPGAPASPGAAPTNPSVPATLPQTSGENQPMLPLAVGGFGLLVIGLLLLILLQLGGYRATLSALQRRMRKP